jgi:hypothetical protein
MAGEMRQAVKSEFAKLITRINKAKDNPSMRNTKNKNEASAIGDKKNVNENFRGPTKLIVIPPFLL